MSAAEHLREAIDVGRTRDDHDHVADHRAKVLREAADFIDNDDTCDCDGCETCALRRYAADLRRMADEAATARQLARFEDAQQTLQQLREPGPEYREWVPAAGLNFSKDSDAR
ncbi:hypothetical protein ACFRQM_09645 [Streptomyces sp. NPDC056831]|uniref:hypothetical protein n=1 Tax=Streptomyces sp. NPDC056831 TaxID=3345954 RepID=UPI00368D4A6E